MLSLNHHHHHCHCHHHHHTTQCDYCIFDHLNNDDDVNLDHRDNGGQSSSSTFIHNDQQQQQQQLMTTTSTNVAYISNQNEIDVNEHQMNDATTMKMKMMMMKNSTTINEQQPFDQDGFVGIELRLMRNLIILSFTSTMILGILQNLLTIDRYQYGQWTYIGFAIGFMFSALSVYYAQAFVQRFGPKRTLIISTVAIILFIFIHYFHNFILFQMAIILFTIFIGPFYAAQLEFISKFMSNLVHLTQTIKRYQEERYQRLLHQLLFCPSLIVGHLIYVIVFASYSSSSSSSKSSSHHINGSKFHHNHETWTSSSSSSSIKPICIHLFRQQYCDQAFYYIFSHHYHDFRPSTSSSSSSGDISLSYNNLQQQTPTFDQNFIKILVTIFIIISLSILMAIIFLLNHQEYYQQQQQVPLEHRSYPSCSIRNVIFRTFRDNHLRLLLPMAFFIGFEQGFFMADYNKLYVSCALGLQAIGSIMLTRGFVHLGATLLVYEFIRHIQRPIVLLAGAICQLSVLAILYLWRPNDDIPLYYVITITYSLANAIMETLLLKYI
ncbi:hypothetical protein DERF_014085 [Dermatophagoides farinae]|uniref:Uncharacterized protein n=1 Tax=Dermatophagoides farinae TaxID=6954 RepID=A0A922KW86_DERFA|nr:hypothetical protein DERF_014085 [Dermatophagoides farinae]